MANKVYNMDGGLHSSAALGGLEDGLYGSSVANSSSFVCSAGSGMNVTVSTGNGLISTGTGFARRIATDSTNTVSVTAASTANPRIDSIVAYINNSVSPSTSVVNNTNGILNFKSVAGSPAATPSAPSASTIQSSVGAGNPYMVLYNVRIPANATSLTAATFTDMRNIANLTSTSDIVNGAVTAAKLASGAVTSAKIDWTTIIGTIVDSNVDGSGYIDLGTIRIQWSNNRYTSLTTTAGAYNTWDNSWAVPFATATYAALITATSDVGNIAGGELKVVGKTTTKTTVNYNHTGAIGSSSIYYTVIGIGLKP